MRLWSLHPKYLDARGLVACWREGLLARHVLLGLTRGYRNHPQLERLRATQDPAAYIDAYLSAVCDEADHRGYRFSRGKIGEQPILEMLSVTAGQISYEFEHLKGKLAVRDPQRLETLKPVDMPEPHPIFRVVPGGIESWEKIA
jgi:hypothetical protein